MFRALVKIYRAKDIRSRILTRGVGLTLTPVVCVLLVIWITNSVANSVAVDGYSGLANKDLNRVVLSVASACKLYNGYLSQAVSGASTVLNRTGPVHFDASESITWQAKNQFTAKTTPVNLPLMMVGETALRPVVDPGKPAPVVDEVEALYHFSSTVFQRMNPQGDMLRVSTTVKKADGTRAIGTYIPAIGPDGKPNVVLSTVLQGKTYLGRAFVVNAWYMAAYQPIKDASGSVIGVIYTGIPEAQVRDKILDFKNTSDVSGSSDVFIVHTAGKEHGLFVFANDAKLSGQPAWDYRDARGGLFVQDVCKSALNSKGGIAETSYWTPATKEKPAQKMLVRSLYFPDWDWVIAVQEPEQEFVATPARIRNIFLVSNFLPLLMVIAATAGAIFIWDRLARGMTEQVAKVMKKLEKSSRQVTKVVEKISGSADSVGDAAEELSRTTQSQASSVEETATTTSSIANTAKKNSETAETMLTLAKNSESMVAQAKTVMGQVNGAMESILSTNDEAMSIIDTINEISFATNIVALNASVEAARAGEAGRTFVFIADEVRDLAKKVSAAVQETRQIITRSREQLDSGTRLFGKLSLCLDPLNENADHVRRLAFDVTNISADQANGMQEVLGAVEQIRRSTEQTTDAAVQSSLDASELRSQLATLVVSVKTVDQAVDALSEEFLAR